YLPTDPGRLRDEVERRGLSVSGQAVFGTLHDPSRWDADLGDAHKVAELVTAMGAGHMVLLPGDAGPNPADLDGERWRTLVERTSELGRILMEEHGVAAVFHPHADSHVGTQPQIERFLQDTDPASVNLCLDTGHVAYYRGDNLELIEKYPDRIGYLHLKQADPAVIEQVRAEGLGFGEAVRRGAMCEPPKGEPDYEALLDAVDRHLDGELFAIVEQDLYPSDPDVPLPIAARTFTYLRELGVGSDTR
ncbi:MAG TPA: sugar phosphate isomerase/epimerase, partial [Actinomycetota bacterium]|nr:sugar phosphate isomerase/epimerase [Actinomycetota bacterium]